MAPSVPPPLHALLVLTVGVVGQRPQLHVAGFLPATGVGFPIYPVARPAVDLAVNLINNSTDILPDYELKLEIYDTQHSASIGMRRFLEMINGNTTKLFLLGPAISAVSVHVCVAAASWNLVQVTFSSRSSELEDRELYPFFFRTIPSDSMLNALRHQLLRHFGWSRVAVIYEKNYGNLFYAGLPALVDLLRADGIEVLTFQGVDNDHAATIATLKELDARIIICHVFFLMARNLFCEAYRQALYGRKYVWLLPGWAGDAWWRRDNTDPDYNCTAEQLTEAQDGHFSVNYISYTSDNTSVLGMTVKEFREAMSPAGSSSEYSAYAFDAMLTIGHILHIASRDRGLNLSEFTYDSTIFSSIFVEELLKLQIVGISGPVSFDALGNRLGVSVLEQSQGGSRRLIGKMEPYSHALIMDPTAQVQWKGDRKPRDGPFHSRSVLFLPRSATVVISVLSALGFIATCAFIAFNFKFAHLKVIKLSSPNMNNVISVGCSIGYISVVIFGLDGRQLDSDSLGVVCHARMFILSVAYSLAFGALFFKTWRVHLIMANKRLDKIKLKDRHLLAWIGGLVALDVLFLSIWATVDRLHRTLVPLPLHVDPDDSDHILEPFIEKCTCQKEEYWLGAMLVYKGLLLLFGLFLAWETRHIQVQALNDSKYIGMSVYNLSLVCFVGVPVGFFINDEYYVGSYVISSVFIIFAVTVTLCFVFVPKIHAIYHDPSGEVEVRFPTSRPSATNEGGPCGGDTLDISFTPCTARVTPVGQAALSIAIQRRLERMVAERDTEISELRKEMASLRNSSVSAIGIESIM